MVLVAAPMRKALASAASWVRWQLFRLLRSLVRGQQRTSAALEFEQNFKC